MPLSQLKDSFIQSLLPHFNLQTPALLPALLVLLLPACTRPTPGFCMVDTDCPTRNQFCSLPAQQCSSAVMLHAVLSGDQVVPPTASQASGDFTLVVNDAHNSGHYTLNLSFAAPATSSTPMAAEIRSGSVGLGSQSGVAFARIDVSKLPAVGDLELTSDLLLAMRAGQYYIVVTSTTFANGEIRGQLFSPDPADANPAVHLAGILSGEQSAPGVPSMGAGTVTADLAEGSGQLSVTYSLSGLGGTINGFHIHRGGFNENGDIIYTLPTPAATTMSDTIMVGVDQIQAPQSHIFGLLFKSGLTYLNVHTTAFAAGEIRAQLMPPSPQMTYALPFNITLAHATGSGSLGEAEFFLSADKTMLAYRISHTVATPMAAMLVRGAGITSPVTCAALASSAGATGAQGYCAVDPNAAMGTTPTMTLGDLTTSSLNFVVTSSLFPMGELRGQVIVPK